MQLVTDSRGIHKNMEYITTDRIQLTYELPLEIVFNFYDKIKNLSRGDMPRLIMIQLIFVLQTW